MEEESTNDDEEISLDEDEFIRGFLPNVVSRESWGAQPSRDKREIKKSIKRLVLTCTNWRRCFSKEHCKHNLRVHQAECLSGGRYDIPYNFLIGSDGRIYEGMGWNHMANCNFWSWLPMDRPIKEMYEDTIHVAFMGFKGLKPSMKQVKAALSLVLLGQQNKTLFDNIDIIEIDIKGPVFPGDLGGGRNKLFPSGEGELDEDDYREALDMINEDIKNDAKKMTMEQMLEELKTFNEEEFNKYDEELKEYCQKYIEKNYPWAFKTKSDDKAKK